MIINTVKRDENEKGVLIGYWLNGNSYVPISDDNRHYRAITEWIENGNVPEPADIIEPPDTTEQDASVARLRESAKTKPDIADILILLGK